MSIDISTLSIWDDELAADPTTQLAATVAANHGTETSLINRKVYTKNSINLFSNLVTPEGAPVRNQKASGRCWLFAATNALRVDIIRRFNLSELELSPSYLFFYDKLEKANFFLDQIAQTAHTEEYDGRLVQHLLTDPVCDGGQYDMFRNIVTKYGIVPNHIYPESFSTLSSRGLNGKVVTLLRQFAQEIREAPADTDIEALKKTQMQKIHKLLTVYLGTPPGPNDPIVWEYVDKDKKYNSLETTPLKFYQEVVKYDANEAVSLLNDPRNPYDSIIEVDRLGNVVGEPYVRYLNVSIEDLTNYAVEQIKANKPVFFGTHTPIYHDKKSGIIDQSLWDYHLIGFEPTQSKADRLRYHQSLMTHAMTFVGVHLDPVTGAPVRWKVENSWGTDSGTKGYYTLTQEFFKEYVYQIVVQKADLSEQLQAKWDKAEVDVVLPPWDPCGALAN